MRLLSLKEVEEASKVQKRSLSNQVLKTEKALSLKQKELNDLRDSFLNQKQKATEEHLAFLEEKLRERSTIESELAELEVKRTALIASSDWKQLEERKEELDAREHALSLQKEFLDEEGIKILRAREQMESDARKSDALLSQIEDQKESTERALKEALESRESAQSLKQEAESYLSYAKEQSALLLTDLDERKRTVEMEEKALRALHKTIDNDRANLEAERAHIESQQQTLKQAFREARRKGII